MHERFPDIFGNLSAKDKAKIVSDDLWIHGDKFVKSVIDELRLEDPSIPEWEIGESTKDQRAFLDDVS